MSDVEGGGRWVNEIQLVVATDLMKESAWCTWLAVVPGWKVWAARAAVADLSWARSIWYPVTDNSYNDVES